MRLGVHTGWLFIILVVSIGLIQKQSLRLNCRKSIRLNLKLLIYSDYKGFLVHLEKFLKAMHPKQNQLLKGILNRQGFTVMKYNKLLHSEKLLAALLIFR